MRKSYLISKPAQRRSPANDVKVRRLKDGDDGWDRQPWPMGSMDRYVASNLWTCHSEVDEVSVALNRMVMEQNHEWIDGQEFPYVHPYGHRNRKAQKAEIASALRPVVEDALDCLSKREREVVIRWFGLRGYSSQDAHTIAADCRMSRDKVFELRQKAIGKLRGARDMLMEKYKQVDV